MKKLTKVWFVTGASKGLGLSLVKKLLSEDYKVAARSRSVESLTNAVGANIPNFLQLQVALLNNGSLGAWEQLPVVKQDLEQLLLV